MSIPYPDPPTGPSAHRNGLNSETRGWGVAAHLSAFVGAWVFLAFLGPLVVWLLGRERHGFIDHHAKEALNFNLTFLLVTIVGGVIGVVGAVLTLGLGLFVLLPLAAAIAIGWIVLTIIAAVKAWDGEGYRYPFTIRFIS